jgi:hypothetical protein
VCLTEIQSGATIETSQRKQQSLQRPYNKAGLLQNKLTSIALSVILETSWETRLTAPETVALLVDTESS